MASFVSCQLDIHSGDSCFKCPGKILSLAKGVEWFRSEKKWAGMRWRWKLKVPHPFHSFLPPVSPSFLLPSTHRNNTSIPLFCDPLTNPSLVWKRWRVENEKRVKMETAIPSFSYLLSPLLCLSFFLFLCFIEGRKNSSRGVRIMFLSFQLIFKGEKVTRRRRRMTASF